MNEEKIIYKLKSYLHHADFPENLLDKDIFKNLIKEKKIMYDHSADKSKDRFKNSKPLNEFDDVRPLLSQSECDKALPNSKRFADGLITLPLHSGVRPKHISEIVGVFLHS